MPVARPLRCHRGFDPGRELVIGLAGTHRRHQIELLGGEQTRTELALRREAHPITVATERLGHRGDHADRAATVEIAEPVGWGRTARRQLLERVDGADRFDDLVLADDLVVHPVTVGIERHELDEAHLDVTVAAEFGERHDLVVVDATFDDGVDLDRREPGFLGRLDAVEHTLEFVAARHLMESRAVEGVEADVDPTQPCVTQRLGHQAHRGAVGGHRQIDRTIRPLDRCELLDEHGQVRTHGGLTAGEADPPNAVPLHEHAGEPLDLLERHHLRARQPLHPFLGHAVGAAEVAPIGDRDAQVLDDAPERIDQLLVRSVGPP